MHIDGFELKIHSLVGLIIALAVFWAAYRLGQSKSLDGLPFFRSKQS